MALRKPHKKPDNTTGDYWRAEQWSIYREGGKLKMEVRFNLYQSIQAKIDKARNMGVQKIVVFDIPDSQKWTGRMIELSYGQAKVKRTSDQSNPGEVPFFDDAEDVIE